MNPVQIFMLVVVLMVAAFATARLTARDPAPKRFGLKEAEAAAQYISTADAARPVMAVIVGVLGYENAVAGDLTDVAAKAATLNGEAHIAIDEASWEISDLKRKIGQLQSQIDIREAELMEKKLVADLFTA